MDSPVTRRANVFRVGLNPMLATSTDTQPSASCSLSWAKLAGMVPKSGNVHDPSAELLQRRGDPQSARLACVRFDEFLAFERRQMNRRPPGGRLPARRF
jgi:hypothetical protein